MDKLVSRVPGTSGVAEWTSSSKKLQTSTDYYTQWNVLRENIDASQNFGCEDKTPNLVAEIFGQWLYAALKVKLPTTGKNYRKHHLNLKFQLIDMG